MPEPDVLHSFLRNWQGAATFPDGRPKKILKAGLQLRITNSVLSFEANTGKGRTLDKQVPCLPPCRTAVPLRRALEMGLGDPIRLHGHQLQRT